MTFMGASAHGLYQQLTPVEEGIPTYFPPTEQLSIIGEDVPEIGSNQTFDLMQSLKSDRMAAKLSLFLTYSQITHQTEQLLKKKFFAYLHT